MQKVLIKIFNIIKHKVFGPEIAIFHKFQKPPYGGGNQFLIALTKELVRQGFDVGTNTVGKKTKVVLFNSFEFDKEKLGRFRKKYGTRMIQRLAGPIGVYRGTDNQIDKDIWELNGKYADATIFISDYSYKKYSEIGLVFKEPHTILNASDPDIFNTIGRITPPDGNRKIKLIATAWSNNPKKGGPILSWLDENLDHKKFELTFVGRTEAKFKGAKIVEPVPSLGVARLLKENDIYIAPSEDDPCSNALVEALSCGLPAAFRVSGGHPELVGQGGEGFTDGTSLIDAINKISNNYEYYADRVKSRSIKDVTAEYLKVFFPNE